MSQLRTNHSLRLVRLLPEIIRRCFCRSRTARKEHVKAALAPGNVPSILGYRVKDLVIQSPSGTGAAMHSSPPHSQPVGYPKSEIRSLNRVYCRTIPKRNHWQVFKHYSTGSSSTSSSSSSMHSTTSESPQLKSKKAANACTRHAQNPKQTSPCWKYPLKQPNLNAPTILTTPQTTPGALHKKN